MDNTSDNQMDRPSTPTDAAAARLSPDDKDHVPSLDPPSTRPNPFDDSDLLARKRRRTSGSASPPPSASTQDKMPTPLSNHLSAEATGANHTAFDQQVQDEAVTATEIPELLHTPQAPTFIAPNSSTPLSSSKVTINLRNSNGLALDASGPSSPTSKQLTSPTITNNGSHAGENVAYTKNEQLPETTNVGTYPKSRSNSTSPPVELVSVSDTSSEEGDDKMMFSVDDKAAAIVGHDLPSFDPILQFPYSEPEDDPSTPLHRLLEYLSTRTCASHFFYCRSFPCELSN